jgi:hypothetical protein
MISFWPQAIGCTVMTRRLAYPLPKRVCRFWMRPLAIASVVFFCFGLATLLCLGFFLYPFRFLFFLFAHAPPLPPTCHIGRTLGTAKRAPVSVSSYTGGRRLAASRFNQAGQVSSNGDTGSPLEARTRAGGRPSFPSVIFCLFLFACTQNLSLVNTVYLHRRAIHWAILGIRGAPNL